jgi:AraC-like DNA-binding protein
MTAGYRERPQILIAGIEAVWASQTHAPGSYRVLPDGRCDLILRYTATPNGPTDIEPILTGTAARAHDVPLIPNSGFVGARFRPGHAARFLRISPMSLGPEGKRGAQVLSLCPHLSSLIAPVSDPTMLEQRLTRFLAETAHSAPPPAPWIQALGQAFHVSSGRLSVAELARLHGLSLRHLTRKWQEMTGFTPKTYTMVLQFQRALRLIELHGLTAAEAAFEAGYADQAHMTRAFRQFAGFTPGDRRVVTLVSMAG